LHVLGGLSSHYGRNNVPPVITVLIRIPCLIPVNRDLIWPIPSARVESIWTFSGLYLLLLSTISPTSLDYTYLMPFLDYFFKRPSYELSVSHYYRGQSPEVGPYPFHRAIFLRTEPEAESPRGTLYQLVPAGAKFRFFQQNAVDVAKPDTFAGLVKIGTVRPADRHIVENILQGVPIEQDTNAYIMGQEWSRDAVRRLAKGGFIDLDLLAKLYSQLEEQEKDYLFHMLHERSSPRDSVSYLPLVF
jgi:hypothetical protein